MTSGLRKTIKIHWPGHRIHEDHVFCRNAPSIRKRSPKIPQNRGQNGAGTEEKQVILFSLNRDITEKLILNLSYTFVEWKNAGFNPEVPLLEEDLLDITKHSMGIAIQYRY